MSSGGPDLAARPGIARRLAGDAALALGFLTIVPVPAVDPGPEGIGRAAVWFPLVGAAVGALAGGTRALLQPALGPLPATVVAVIALVTVTGALHQDGLADTADGLGVRGDRERRLAAMRDSAVGAYGVLALIGWALLLVTTVAELSVHHAVVALVTAAAAGRWAALAHAVAVQPARADGLGAGFAVGRARLVIATVLVVALAAGLCRPLPGLAALAAAVVVTPALTSLFARRTLGGRTGDTLGATVALTELAVCLVLTSAWQA